MNSDNLTYFDSFGVEHIKKNKKKFIDNKNITTNKYAGMKSGENKLHRNITAYFFQN